MAKQIRWLLLVLVGLFACAGTQESEGVPTATAPLTAVPTALPVQTGAVGEPLHGYVNVAYTQADGDLIGKTKRAQMLNIYATW